MNTTPLNVATSSRLCSRSFPYFHLCTWNLWPSTCLSNLKISPVHLKLFPIFLWTITSNFLSWIFTTLSNYQILFPCKFNLIIGVPFFLLYSNVCKYGFNFFIIRHTQKLSYGISSSVCNGLCMHTGILFWFNVGEIMFFV